MGMAHSTSGRRGFEDIPVPVDFLQYNQETIRQKVKYDTVKAMLILENELRLSEKYQQMYRDEAKYGLEGYCCVTEKLQLEVIQECALLSPEPRQYGLYVLQTAELLYPEKREEIRELSLYRKFNRMMDGNLVVGVRAPAVRVLDMAGQLIELPLGMTDSTVVNVSDSTTGAGGLSSSVFQCDRGGSSSRNSLVLIAGSAS
jgi:hypothetical protein